MEVNTVVFTASAMEQWCTLGDLRTIGQFRLTYDIYMNSGADPKTMEDFENVIYPCLLDGNEEKTVLYLPPSELHLSR